ncbi:hypothetical protein, partial [Flavobacterium aurantiibacter]|uniref:hypothetical protein n=1 Tax=Flavobacterium aurantiibacter TaxID=2023067 RepID=UPI001A9C2A56
RKQRLKNSLKNVHYSEKNEKNEKNEKDQKITTMLKIRAAAKELKWGDNQLVVCFNTPLHLCHPF